VISFEERAERHFVEQNAQKELESVKFHAEEERILFGGE
jgi:hypothetical protein